MVNCTRSSPQKPQSSCTPPSDVFLTRFPPSVTGSWPADEKIGASRLLPDTDIPSRWSPNSANCFWNISRCRNSTESHVLPQKASAASVSRPCAITAGRPPYGDPRGLLPALNGVSPALRPGGLPAPPSSLQGAPSAGVSPPGPRRGTPVSPVSESPLWPPSRPSLSREDTSAGSPSHRGSRRRHSGGGPGRRPGQLCSPGVPPASLCGGPEMQPRVTGSPAQLSVSCSRPRCARGADQTGFMSGVWRVQHMQPGDGGVTTGPCSSASPLRDRAAEPFTETTAPQAGPPSLHRCPGLPPPRALGPRSAEGTPPCARCRAGLALLHATPLRTVPVRTPQGVPFG